MGAFFDGELSSASFVLDAAIVHTFVHESTGYRERVPVKSPVKG